MITTKGFFMSHSESFKYQIVTKYLCGKLHIERDSFEPPSPVEGIVSCLLSKPQFILSWL